ncbi:hypothetical protein [Chryseobacterium sp.]|uniref:hypothetical protein n=1 Tax=Chryseobacterium sp. TaxID=1871047 RepID=UPI0012A88EAB|nr:hypothetical protein [Chryseobacterium sp.]QFG54458.1 hypothetical protein F7R58_12645 [Chryseobacterium sp.]
MESFVGQYNSYVKTRIEDLFKNLENPVMQQQTENIAESVALICGIWNGLVDFVSSIFKFIAMLLEAPFNITKDFQHILEMIDDFWDMLKDGNLWNNLETAVSAGMEKMVEYLKSKNTDDINWVRLHYIAGFTIAFVGTLFIPITGVVKAANAGKYGEIFAELNTKINAAVIKTSNFSKKVETTAVYKGAGEALQELIEMFSKGGRKLQNFVDDVWKEIVEWFFKNKEKYQELTRYGKALLERTARTYAKKYP